MYSIVYCSTSCYTCIIPVWDQPIGWSVFAVYLPTVFAFASALEIEIALEFALALEIALEFDVAAVYFSSNSCSICASNSFVS